MSQVSVERVKQRSQLKVQEYRFTVSLHITNGQSFLVNFKKMSTSFDVFEAGCVEEPSCEGGLKLNASVLQRSLQEMGTHLKYQLYRRCVVAVRTM